MLAQVFLTRSAEEVTRQGPKDGDLQLSGFHEAPSLTARALILCHGVGDIRARHSEDNGDSG